MSHKRLHNRCVKRNESVRVAEAEIENAESLPAIPTTITDVVEAIENGTIPEREILQKIREVDCSGNSCRFLRFAHYLITNARAVSAPGRSDGYEISESIIDGSMSDVVYYAA